MSQPKPSTWMIALFVLFLLLTIVALVGVSAITGASDMTVNDAYSAILHKFFPDRYAPSWFADVCIWNIRLPRIFMGILAGISLGLAGATMQWALKNPLASPYTLGISHTVAFGTYVAIIIGGASIKGGGFLILGAAGISVLIATAIILHISRRRWATPERVVLLGIIMTFIISALTTILMYFGEAGAVKETVFWMVGDLGRSSWDVLAYMAGTIVLYAILLLLLIFILSLFGVDKRRIRTYAMAVASLLVAIRVCFTGMIGDLGRSSWDVLAYMAGTIVLCAIPLLLLIFMPSLFGVDERRIRTYAMVVVCLLVAITVHFTGTIGFIGLLAPHICRLVIGDDHRFVIPISGLVGAVLLLGLGLVAGTVISPVIIPVGVLTTLMGAPLFAYLIVREGRKAV